MLFKLIHDVNSSVRATLRPSFNLTLAPMPGLFIALSGTPNDKLTLRVVPRLVSLTCEILDKKLEHTMVMVHYVANEHWFIAGKSLAELGKNSFRLEVTITDETNTKTQKAEYSRAVFAELSGLIGNVHAHSNIHLIDCRAAAYSYGGVTQEFRYQHMQN